MSDVQLNLFGEQDFIYAEKKYSFGDFGQLSEQQIKRLPLEKLADKQESLSLDEMKLLTFYQLNHLADRLKNPLAYYEKGLRIFNARKNYSVRDFIKPLIYSYLYGYDYALEYVLRFLKDRNKEEAWIALNEPNENFTNVFIIDRRISYTNEASYEPELIGRDVYEGSCKGLNSKVIEEIMRDRPDLTEFFDVLKMFFRNSLLKERIIIHCSKQDRFLLLPFLCDFVDEIFFVFDYDETNFHDFHIQIESKNKRRVDIYNRLMHLVEVLELEEFFLEENFMRLLI